MELAFSTPHIFHVDFNLMILDIREGLVILNAVL